MPAAAALPLALFGPGIESVESVAVGGEPCASGDLGSPGGCAGGANSQPAATANNIELGAAVSRSIPNPFAAVNPNDPQTWDRYAYVGGSPGSLVDPTGTFWLCAAMDVGAAIIDTANIVQDGLDPFTDAIGYSLTVHALACSFLF